MNPVIGLSLGRIAVGAAAVANPELAARTFRLDPVSNPQVPYVTRLFGSREIALGAITLASSGSARERLVQVGIAVDGADMVTGVAAASTGAVSKKAGIMMAVVAGGAVASGVLSLTD